MGKNCVRKFPKSILTVTLAVTMTHDPEFNVLTTYSSNLNIMSILIDIRAVSESID